jgi:2-amino-4-hydroxy-6-hydroxymethyldihydropteridine diphosphokinase
VDDAVYIGLGSNLGDREQKLLGALEALSRIDTVSVLQRSSLYQSAPVGPSQPYFLNAVVKVACDLAPPKLLSILKQIERDLGRKPGLRWGPRPMDLDILLWEGQVVAEPNLQVPHVSLHLRRFALEPLCEIEPNAWHPVLKITAREMLDRLAPQDVVRYDAVHWR